MATVTGLGLLMASSLTAILSRLFAEELSAWIPSFVRRIITLAVARLPKEYRDRYGEEWSSYVSEVPGNLSKVIAASGLLVAAQRATWLMRRDYIVEGWMHSLAQLESACFKAKQLYSAIEGDPSLPLPVFAELSPRLRKLRLYVAEVEAAHQQIVNAINPSSVPDSGLLGYFYCAVWNRLAGERFRHMAQSARTIANSSDLILNWMRERAKT